MNTLDTTQINPYKVISADGIEINLQDLVQTNNPSLSKLPLDEVLKIVESLKYSYQEQSDSKELDLSIKLTDEKKQRLLKEWRQAIAVGRIHFSISNRQEKEDQTHTDNLSIELTHEKKQRLLKEWQQAIATSHIKYLLDNAKTSNQQ